MDAARPRQGDATERRHGSVRWPLAASIAATLAIAAIAALLIVDSYNGLTTRAREGAANVLSLIERDIARNVEVLDLSLKAAVEGVGRPDVMGSDPELRRMILFDRAASASGLGALVVFDADGRLILDSAGVEPRQIAPVTDREYFQAHEKTERGLYISRPYRSRLIGQDVVGLSHRISSPDGSFAGVALATIETAYLTGLLSRLQLGPRGAVSLVRDDGAILVRAGSAGPSARQDLAGTTALDRLRNSHSGTFRAVSAIDGIERLYTFSRIGDLPLTVSVGLAVEDVYSDWAAQTFLIVLVLCLICAGIIALTVRLTAELGRRAAAESALVAMNAELVRLSRTDALTKLGNRRLFDEELERELARAKRTRRRLSLIVLDVDHFKRFNDHYGHQAGDAALAAIGSAMGRSSDRPADMSFRIGGEEFAMLLPETDLPGAMRVAERIRTEVRSLARPHPGSPSGFVTVSLGVAEIQEGDAAVAYARADAALYRAKQAGRDRVFPGELLPVAA